MKIIWLRKILLKLSVCFIAIFLTACTPTIVNETPDRVDRNSIEAYTISARVKPRNTRIAAVNATVDGRRVTMEKMMSSELWTGDYFGGPCLGNVTYSYKVEYNPRNIIGRGFSSVTNTLTDPRIGQYQVTIDGVRISGCPSNPGRVYNVRSTTDAVDNDLTDGICQTSAGECTLRAAVMQANANPGHDRIYIRADNYVLSLVGSETTDGVDDRVGDLDITDGVSIIGNTNNVTIDAGRNFRIFHVSTDSENVTQLTRLRIVDGRANGGPGGAIWNNGILRLSHMTIENNGTFGPTCGNSVSRLNCNRGGAILNQGELYVSDSTLKDNYTFSGGVSGQGGAISNFGENAIAIVERSLIEGNKARFVSGVMNYLGTVEITNSTFVDNPGHAWGLIANYGGTILVENTTIGRNSSSDNNVNIFRNRNSSGFDGSFRVKNSLVAATNNRSLCNSNVETGGFNVIEDGARGFGACRLTGSLSYTDVYDSTINVGSLGRNGGPTMTIALRAGFRYLDHGAIGCPRVDQRGFMRPIDGTGNGAASCDPGAYEFNPQP